METMVNSLRGSIVGQKPQTVPYFLTTNGREESKVWTAKGFEADETQRERQ